MCFLTTNLGNIALYKPTSQSSTSSDYRSSRAVDGRKLTNLYDESCTRTFYQSRPWWRVDLLESVPLYLVKITNRGDCCWTRLRDVQIRIGDSSSGPDNNSMYVEIFFSAVCFILLCTHACQLERECVCCEQML